MMEYIWYNKIMRDEENLDSFKFSEFEIQKNRELQALMDEFKASKALDEIFD